MLLPVYSLPVSSKEGTMARVEKRLSAVEVNQAKPSATGASRILADGGGLRLVIKPTGAKYWQFKTARGGKETSLQLGSFPQMSLGEARSAAETIRKQQSAGLDPLQERKMAAIRRQSESEATFRVVASELLDIKRRNGLSASYLKKIEGAVEGNLIPKLGPMPIQKIEAPYLKTVLKRIEARGSLDMLNFMLRITGEVFDLAKSNGQFTGDNPARALRSNVFQKHKKGQMAALPWGEMNGFLHRLDGCYGEFATICCVRLMIWTATRPGEARGARWAEFDLDGACWTIPADRMKSRKEHRIPLARQAVDMLRQLHPLTGDGEYLFPGQLGAKTPVLSDMGVLKAVRRTAGHDNVDAHGFRAVFRTHAEESGLWPFEVMEAALAHGKQSQVVGSYARATHYAQRAKLAQWYADQLDQVKRGATVVSLGAVA
jgi:integrase